MKQLALLGPQIDFCVKASRKLEASSPGTFSSCFKTRLGQETAKHAMLIRHLPNVANRIIVSTAQAEQLSRVERLLLMCKEPTDFFTSPCEGHCTELIYQFPKVVT